VPDVTRVLEIVAALKNRCQQLLELRPRRTVQDRGGFGDIFLRLAPRQNRAFAIEDLSKMRMEL
jgi:hypothetical protein